MEEMNRTHDPITTERLNGAPADPTYRREAKDTVAGDDYEYPIFKSDIPTTQASISDQKIPDQRITDQSQQDWNVNTSTADRRIEGRTEQRTDQRLQDAGAAAPLFSAVEIGDLRARWSDVQAGFVDEPRRAVEEADELVVTVMQRITDSFANERSTLEKQWDSGSTVSTEELRVALQRYRSFFGRLLNAA